MAQEGMTSPNPLVGGKEHNQDVDKSADQMNEAVLRITGMRSTLLREKGQSKQEASGMPDSLMASQAKKDQPNRGPESAVFSRETNSVTRPMPKRHDMPVQKVVKKEPGSDENGEPDAETVGTPPKAEGIDHVRLLPERQAFLETAMNTRTTMRSLGLRDMSEWRSLAGLPELTESERGTGSVPTPGVNKENPVKGGLPGLEGTPMSNLQAQKYGDDGDEDEATLDQHPGDMKSEEYEAAFQEYLENKGVHPALFAQLVDEAMDSNDVDEMDALIRVEEDFQRRFFPKRGKN